jgi:hypothetical protein
MITRWLMGPLVVVALTFAGASAGDKKGDENPYRNAKIGDFANYKMTTKIGENAIEGVMKQVVTAKDDTTVTVKTTISAMGLDLHHQAIRHRHNRRESEGQVRENRRRQGEDQGWRKGIRLYLDQGQDRRGRQRLQD